MGIMTPPLWGSIIGKNKLAQWFPTFFGYFNTNWIIPEYLLMCILPVQQAYGLMSFYQVPHVDRQSTSRGPSTPVWEPLS